MTTEINVLKPNVNKEYPWVGVVDELVVLFTAPKKGVVLACRPEHTIGDTNTAWIEEDFEPGSITLNSIKD